MRKRIPPMLCLLALLVAVPTAALAQSTTATLQGRVTDEDGKAVAGASVIATSLSTGLARPAETDGKGHYVIPALPPGDYKVEATKIGLYATPFQAELRVGQSVVLDIEMAKQQVEVVTVTAERPILNTTETEVATVVGPSAVRELPLINRDFTDLANIAPGAKPKQTGQVDPTKNEGIYRPFTIGAGNGREVNVQIDGGDNNDNAVGTFAAGLTLEAVQEFEVVTNQYKAEYGRATQGVVNVITKSGSNDLNGSVFGLYRDDGFRRKNFSEQLAGTDKSESERKQFGLSVGGPLMQDRLFGFLAYERIEEDAPIAYSPVLTGFARTASLAGQTFTTGLERDLYHAKLSLNAASNHTAYLRYYLDDNEFLNDQGGATTAEQFNGNSINEVWSLLGNWTTVIRGNMVNEFTLNVTDFENGIVSNTPEGSLDFITTENYDQISLGRNRNTPQATLIEKLQIKDDFSWILGEHELKFGFDVIDLEFPDSNLGLPDRPTVNFSFDTGVTPDAVDADPNNLALLDSVFFDNPGFIPGSDYLQVGVYAQDTWRINDRWTVNFGLRYDTDSGLFDPQKEGINRTFYQSVANSTTADRPQFRNVFPEDPETWAPRVGFVHRVKGQDNNVIRGSWGLFYDKIIENLTIFSTQNLSPVFFPSLPSLDCSGGDCAAGFDVDGAGPLAPLPADFTLANWQNAATGLQSWYGDLVSILGPLNTTTGQALFVPSPDWDMPYVSSWSLGWGHRFDRDWSLDTNAIYSEGYRQLRFFDVRGTPGGSRNTGIVPASDASREAYFVTDGRTEYISLQTRLQARKPMWDLAINLNISRARGTQDTGASANESGTIDIFSGGNRRYTGDPTYNRFCNSATPHGNPATFSSGPVCTTERAEFGPISGDQFLWTSLYFQRRLPLAFSVSGNVAYGSEIAFWPWAGYDQNNDGFLSGSEYLGSAGSGQGDDFFVMDVRAAKKFGLPRGVDIDVFLEVFNLTNTTNFGLFVDQRQAGSGGRLNTNYLQPTGNFLGNPRTWNAGFRVAWGG